MPVHTVKQGEHISGIAHHYGFEDYRTIWEHSENQELKDRRKNGNTLFPGDEVFIPDLEEKWESGATETRHRFRRNTSPLKLRVVLRDYGGQPLRETECELIVDMDRVGLTTDGDGMIEHPIPKDLERAQLVVPCLDSRFELQIGHLDPISEESGQRARLNNMGYFSGYSQEDTEWKSWAVEEFQHRNKLKVTGVCDSRTQARLTEVYGC